MKKMLPWLVMTLVAITLIGLAAFILWDYIIGDDAPNNPQTQAIESVKNLKAKSKSAKERQELSVEINDIITNLSDQRFVIKLGLVFEMDNKYAKEEFQLLKHKMKDRIIKTLADLQPDDIQGSEGHDALKSSLLNEMNVILTTGKVTNISITNYALSSQ